MLLVTAIPLFSEGSFTQFGGGLDVIGGVPGVIWIFVLSLRTASSEQPALPTNPRPSLQTGRSGQTGLVP